MMRRPVRLSTWINLGLLAFYLISTQWARLNAQCTPEEYSRDCIQKIHDGFIYLKSYNIDDMNGPVKEVEYSAVFSKDTKYDLLICSRSSQNSSIKLTVYNAKREVMATLDTGPEGSAEIEFNCDQTGIYYLTFTSQGQGGSCGGCVLSFKK